MDEIKYYKPNGRFSVIGLILLIVSMIVVGCALSALYLKINQICTIAFLCVLASCGLGAVMGLVANLFIKVFKMRNPIIAFVGILLACLVVTYFKWGLYCYWDNKDNYYDALNESTAPTAYEWVVNEINMTPAQAEFLAEECNTTLSALKRMTPAEFAYSAKYGFYESRMHEKLPEFLEYKYKSFTNILLSPSVMIEKIKDVNKDGRWTFSSRPRYSSYTSSTTQSSANVKGIMLWFVWLGEALVIIFFPIYMGVKRSDDPFIESENMWAEVYQNPRLGFADFNVTKGIIKQIENVPDYLFSYGRTEGAASKLSFVKVKLHHSKFYTENYITLIKMTYNVRNKNYQEKEVMRHFKVSFDFVEKLFDFCRIPKPFEETKKYFQTEAEVMSAAASAVAETKTPIVQPKYDDIFN